MSEKLRKVTIYSDGACSENPGKGGYGAILMAGTKKKEISAGYRYTTNNRMELLGAIEALRALKQPCEVDLYTDSKYICDAVTQGWAVKWRANGWRKADKKPALNPDLWTALLDLLEEHEVKIHWVKGHADNPYNDRCDKLAVAARLSSNLLIDHEYEQLNKRMF